MTELLILKDIYFLLAVILAIIVLNFIILFIGLIVLFKKVIKEMIRKSKEKFLSELFEKNQLDKTIEFCDKILIEKPNNVLALWYLVKSYYSRQEFMKTRDYLERLRKIDPKSESGYAKEYWLKIFEYIGSMQNNV